MEAKEQPPQNEKVDKFLQAKSFEEATKDLKMEDKIEIMDVLLKTTNVNYDEETLKQLELWEDSLTKEFQRKKKN